MNSNINDQEIVDYIESSAILIEKLASEKNKLEKKLKACEADLKSFQKKAAEEPKRVINKVLISKEQADLISNNLVELHLVKNASVNDLSHTLQTSPDKMVDIFNGLILKFAALSVNSRGKGILPETVSKTLTEDEQLEKKAFFTTLK